MNGLHAASFPFRLPSAAAGLVFLVLQRLLPPSQFMYVEIHLGRLSTPSTTLRPDTTERDVTGAAACRQDQRDQLSEKCQSFSVSPRSISLAGSPGRSNGKEIWVMRRLYKIHHSTHVYSGPGTSDARVAFHRRQMHGRYVPRHPLLCGTSWQPGDWSGDDPGWDKPLQGASRGLCDGVAPSTLRANVEETGGNAADICR